MKKVQEYYHEEIEAQMKRLKQNHFQEVDSINLEHKLEIDELMRKYVKPMAELETQTYFLDQQKPQFLYTPPKRKVFVEDY